MNWYYYDSTGNRRGPINDKQFKELARQGYIMPDTAMETEAGYKGLARQVPGIFTQQEINLEKKQPEWQQTQAPLWEETSPKGGANRFCTNCGKPIGPQAVACMSCGAAPVGHRKFCHICGTSLKPEQIICIKCGSGINAPQNLAPNGYNNAGNYGQAGYQNQPGMYPGNPGMNGGYAPSRPVSTVRKSRVGAGWLAILLGHLGIHKFYMGSWGWGIVYIAAVFGTFFVGWIVTSIVGLIEGISYLMMTDEEFAEKYPNETISPFRW